MPAWRVRRPAADCCDNPCKLATPQPMVRAGRYRSFDIGSNLFFDTAGVDCQIEPKRTSQKSTPGFFAVHRPFTPAQLPIDLPPTNFLIPAAPL